MRSEAHSVSLDLGCWFSSEKIHLAPIDAVVIDIGIEDSALILIGLGGRQI